MSARPDNLNLQTIAALRELLETIDRLDQQLRDAPIELGTWERANRHTETLRAMVTRELAPLELRLLRE